MKSLRVPLVACIRPRVIATWLHLLTKRVSLQYINGEVIVMEGVALKIKIIFLDLFDYGGLNYIWISSK